MKTETTNYNFMSSLEYLIQQGFKPYSDLNYCTNNGIEYHIGSKGNKAIVCALIHSEDIYFIDKDELRQMSFTAKVKGIDKVDLHTNYGIELHSKYENANTIGFNSIKKIINF